MPVHTEPASTSTSSYLRRKAPRPRAITAMARDIDNNEDIIDVRDIIARVEELREERKDRNGDDWEDETENGDNPWATENPEDDVELVELENLLSELAGMGGDEQWEGDWYPVTLIRDSYFQDYAQELAEDLYGDRIRNAEWPMNYIDWESAALELRVDYSAVEYDGVTYWYR